MIKKSSLGAFVAACGMAVLLAACSGSGGSDEVVAGESVYDPGASMAAVGFDEACEIGLCLVDGQGNVFPLKDGDFVEPGNRTLAVEMRCGPSAIDRVYVSDGSAYQVEALPRDGRYMCEFAVSEEDLYQVVLVQVVHPGGRASKDKIVLTTSRPIPSGSYVRNGVGVMAAQELLDLQKQGLAFVLDDKIGEVFDSLSRQGASFITGLSYGDSDPDTPDIVVHALEAVRLDELPSAILRLQFTIKAVSLSALPVYGRPFVSTASNDLLVETCIAVGDTGQDGAVHLVFDLLDSAGVAFSQPFFLQRVLERAIASELKRIELPPLAIDPAETGYETTGLLPESIRVFGSEKDVQGLLDGFEPDLETYVFADVYGIPEATGPGTLALGLGLSSQALTDVVWELPPDMAPPNPIDMEEVFNDLFGSAIDEMFETIRQENADLITHLGYGDNDPSTRDFTIHSLDFHGADSSPDAKTAAICFTVKQVDLEASVIGIPLIKTLDNDLTIEASFSIGYREDGAGKRIVLDAQAVQEVSFAKPFDYDPLLVKGRVEDMIKADLEEMQAREYDIGELIAGFEAGLDLFGSFLANSPYAVFPDLYPVCQDPGWQLALPDTYSLSLALSQAAINQLLAGVIDLQAEWDVYELVTVLLGEDFPGFKQGRSTADRTVMSLSVPPVIDLRDSRIRLELPDIIFQYRTGGAPQWEASLDLCLIIAPSSDGRRLDIDLSSAPGKNHFHVIKDNPGNLGIFDHSSLADDILGSLPRLMGGSADAPFLSFDLDAWEPALAFEDRDEPMSASAGGGYLYLDMAVSGLDIFSYEIGQDRAQVFPTGWSRRGP